MYINLEVLISHYKQNSNYFTVLHLEESFKNVFIKHM